MNRVQATIASTLALLVSLTAPGAWAQAPVDRWTFSLTPYLWALSVDGSLRYGPPAPGGATPNVSIDAGDFLQDLDGAFMLNGTARRGRWSIAADYIYIGLSGTTGAVRSIDFNPGPGPVNLLNTSLTLNAQTKLEGSVWTLVGGYSVVHEPRHTMDIIAGVRYFDLEATTSWQLSAAVAGPVGAQAFGATGSISKSEELWDAIVGVRGRLGLGTGNWFVPYHLDVGSGSSKLTWQGILGLGYSWNWGDLFLAYRYLSYEQGGNKLIEELKFGGFGAGLTFRF